MGSKWTLSICYPFFCSVPKVEKSPPTSVGSVLFQNITFVIKTGDK